RSGVTTFVELGPDAALTGLVRDGLAQENPGTSPERGDPPAVAAAVLRPGHPETAALTSALAEVYATGSAMTWKGAFPDSQVRRLRLPGYAFQRQRHWLDGPDERDERGAGPETAGTGRPGRPERLAANSGQEGKRDLLDAVRTSAAIVLGHPDSGAVDSTRTFKQLGFDSVSAVEFCQRLATATGLPVATTLTYDFPTPERLAAHLTGIADGRASERGVQAGPNRAGAAGEEPLAIVSMSCRYPGGADTPDKLWRLAADGTDAISGFPADRGWEGAVQSEGGFLPDVAQFDAAFFGISPREALAMDPQQRLLLEIAWEAIERAGISPAALHGSSTGVFAGVTSQDYGPRMHEARENVEGYMLTGTTPSVASGRIAYTLGLNGPAITVDTACSSSLVALHLAAQALRNGECDLALAGGAAVMATPGMFTEFSRQGGLAPDGRCKPFASAADGTNWAEGAGLVVIERLSDALANGHPVQALIRGSAINSDGASNGLTAPSGLAQGQVIRQALANARLSPDQVDVVEAHGTGTTLGDPIEARALIATYGQGRPEGHPLRLGSVKSNIGHTQAAAGIAGVIKMVMAMRHGQLPATLHVDRPSPHVDWSAGTVSLLTETVPWPERGHPRRAGVSSFGISGTNAHLILEEHRSGPAAAGHQPVAWPLSARTGPALREQARRLRRHVAEHPELEPADVAFSLASGRALMEHRAVLVAASRTEFIDQLDVLTGQRTGADLATGIASDPGRIVFVFPGQGSQWAGMATALLAESAVFRTRLEGCAEALAPHTGWSVLDVLRDAPGAPPLTRDDVVQPALFAMMVSLAEVWRSLGVRPDAVIGHSQGEIAAAAVAGILSLDDAAKIVAIRSRAIAELAGRGAMASVQLPAEEARTLAGRWPGRVEIAALNGPRSVTVSGDPEAIGELIAAGEAMDVRVRRIGVNYASHCVQVDAIRDRFLDLLGEVTPGPAQIAFCSTVHGELDSETALDAGYWYRNLRQAVQFEPAVTALLGAGHRTFIEVSPHPVLAVPMQEICEHHDGNAHLVSTLRRDDGGWRRVLASAAQAHAAGLPVDWPATLSGGTRQADLPTYPFQRKRYWLPPASATGGAARLGQIPVDHPLLEAVIQRADDEGILATGRLSAADHPWTDDHVVAGAALLPATAFADLARCVADHCGCGGIAELVMEAPLPRPGRGDVRLQVTVSGPDDSGQRSMAVYSRPDDGDPWTRHVHGLLCAGDSETKDSETKDSETKSTETKGSETEDSEQTGTDPAGAWPPAGAVREDISRLYSELAEAGYQYGPAFRGLRAVWRRGNDLYAEACLPEMPDEPLGPERRFGIHPALLDSVLHVVIGRALPDAERPPGTIRLPFSFTGVALSAVRGSVLRARISPVSEDTVEVVATDADGSAAARIDRLTLRPVAAERLAAPGRPAGRELLRLDWVPGPSGAGPAADPGSWLVAGADPLDVAGLLGAASSPDLTGASDRAPAPAVVVMTAVVPEAAAALAAGEPGDVPAMVRELCATVLGGLRQWLSASPLAESRLVVLTRGAVSAVPGDASRAGATGLAGAAIWGLVRSAQTEERDRFVLVDVDGGAESLAALPAAVASGEPQIAVRDGQILVPRLDQAAARPVLTPPAGTGWRLAMTGQGTLDGLALSEDQASSRPLRPGQVRIKVGAAGVNFRDVVVALGLMGPEGGAGIGIEGAGVVLEAAAPANGLAPGDRVMGLLPGGIGPVAVA
ncbi:MAG: acyltransferase domain-containing protein, partial [Nocardiopsaceae bacterium]|nr:acyltransferase domain-containing protein [Nocardiopsaceae bacterium]